jgi:GNAT superfamily N-acetyltransferase
MIQVTLLTLCRYFHGHQLMDMVVVHPAYWKRGHGRRLVRWGMALADLDQVDQGVIAADMGEKLCLSLNYTKLDQVTAEDANAPSPPHSVEVGVLRYSPPPPERFK